MRADVSASSGGRCFRLRCVMFPCLSQFARFRGPIRDMLRQRSGHRLYVALDESAGRRSHLSIPSRSLMPVQSRRHALSRRQTQKRMPAGAPSSITNREVDLDSGLCTGFEWAYKANSARHALNSPPFNS